MPEEQAEEFPGEPLRGAHGDAGTEPEEQVRPGLPEPGEQPVQGFVPRGQGVPAGDEEFPDLRAVPEAGKDRG